MTKVGLITVGQSPRSDVVPDMAAILGGDVEILEAGALDGLSREQIARLAPEGDDEIIVTRLADGAPVSAAISSRVFRRKPMQSMTTRPACPARSASAARRTAAGSFSS